MRKAEVSLGLIIISIGVVFLLNNMGIVNINLVTMWPLALLIPGLLFQLGYFVRRQDPGLLVPGGILLTYGVLFYINIFFGWHLMAYLWPVFPLGVAIGLFQLYIFGGRQTEILVPVAIIGGFSAIALSITLRAFSIRFVMPLVLILFGLYILLRSRR